MKISSVKLQRSIEVAKPVSVPPKREKIPSTPRDKVEVSSSSQASFSSKLKRLVPIATGAIGAVSGGLIASTLALPSIVTGVIGGAIGAGIGFVTGAIAGLASASEPMTMGLRAMVYGLGGATVGGIAGAVIGSAAPGVATVTAGTILGGLLGAAIGEKINQD